MNITRTLALTLMGWMISCSVENKVTEESQRIEKFELTFYHEGGMLPISERIFISDSICYWQYLRYNRETIVNYDLNEDDMQTLSNVLVDHHFDEIQSSRKGHVMDRGGTVISIKQESGVHELNNNGSFFVEEEWLADFKAIKEFIYEMNQTEVERKKVPISVELDESLFGPKKRIKCVFNSEPAFESNSEDVLRSFETRAHIGLNELTVYSFANDSTSNPNQKADLQQNLFVNCAENSVISVGLVAGKIKLL